MCRKIFILILLFLMVYTGYAQNKLNDANLRFAESIAANGIRSKSYSPFGASSLPNLFSSISVSSFFKEGVNGKLELQGKFHSRWSGGLTFDQKIGKTNNEAIPLDLNGISPGTTVKFNLQKMFWHPSFNLTDPQIADLNRVTHTYEARKSMSLNTAGLNEISLHGTAEEKDMAFAAFNSVSFTEPWFINAEVGFTKTLFSYATDSFTLKENQDAFLTPSVTFSIVKAFGSGFHVTGYAAIGYNYTESYHAADDITFSIPFGSGRNYYTHTLSFGKPDKKISHNVTGEFRRNFFTQNNTNIAISPSATVGINSKKLGVFLPVYFIRGADEKGKLIDGLQGGVRFGYTTSTESGKVSSFKKGFIAQLIISQPLDFLGKF